MADHPPPSEDPPPMEPAREENTAPAEESDTPAEGEPSAARQEEEGSQPAPDSAEAGDKMNDEAAETAEGEKQPEKPSQASTDEDGTVKDSESEKEGRPQGSDPVEQDVDEGEKDAPKEDASPEEAGPSGEGTTADEAASDEGTKPSNDDDDDDDGQPPKEEKPAEEESAPEEKSPSADEASTNEESQPSKEDVKPTEEPAEESAPKGDSKPDDAANEGISQSPKEEETPAAEDEKPTEESSSSSAEPTTDFQKSLEATAKRLKELEKANGKKVKHRDAQYFRGVERESRINVPKNASPEETERLRAEDRRERRQQQFNADLAAMREKLQTDEVVAADPIDFVKSEERLKEKRADARREFRSSLYDTRVFLKQHPEMNEIGWRTERRLTLPTDANKTAEMLSDRGFDVKRRKTLRNTAGQDEEDANEGFDPSAAKRTKEQHTTKSQFKTNIDFSTVDTDFHGPKVNERTKAQATYQRRQQAANSVQFGIHSGRRANNVSRSGLSDVSSISGSPGLDASSMSVTPRLNGSNVSARGYQRNAGGGSSSGATKQSESKLLSSVLGSHERQSRAVGGSTLNAARTLKKWFPEDDVDESGLPPELNKTASPQRVGITRTTASVASKRAVSSLAFFDDKGLIDGRDREIPHRTHTGDMYVSPEHNVEVRQATAKAEREAVRERRQKRAAKELGQHQRSVGASTRYLMSYTGPEHTTGHAKVPVPDDHRVEELLSVVYERNGDVSSYLRKMKLESHGGAKPDIRKSGAHRLGGSSRPRMAGL